MLGNSCGITGLLWQPRWVSPISWIIKRIIGFIG